MNTTAAIYTSIGSILSAFLAIFSVLFTTVFSAISVMMKQQTVQQQTVQQQTVLQQPILTRSYQCDEIVRSIYTDYEESDNENEESDNENDSQPTRMTTRRMTKSTPNPIIRYTDVWNTKTTAKTNTNTKTNTKTKTNTNTKTKTNTNTKTTAKTKTNTKTKTKTTPIVDWEMTALDMDYDKIEYIVVGDQSRNDLPLTMDDLDMDW